MERQRGEAETELLSQNESVFDLSLFIHSDQPPPLTPPSLPLDLKTFQIQSVSRAHANIYKQFGFYLYFKNISI